LSLKIGRHIFWLCTKSSDILFRDIESAGKYAAETMLEMMEKDEWEEGFFKGLAKVERTGDDKFTVTTVSEKMWQIATLKLWELNKESKEKYEKLQREREQRMQEAVPQ